jgi:hypothetical protein
MKLGKIGLFMGSLEYAGRSNLRGGPPWAWGRMGPIPFQPHHKGVESNSKGPPPLGRFGKGEEEFLLELGLPLGLEGREGVPVGT